MPTKLGYSTKFPVSSHVAFSLRAASMLRSVSSLSTASRLPNSISSNFMLNPLSASVLFAAVPACCSPWMADSVSSYLRYSFPLRKVKTRICRSERREVVTKCVPEGEKVILFGNDFV